MVGELLTYNRWGDSHRQRSCAVSVVLVVTAGPSFGFRCAASHVHLVEFTNFTVMVWTVVAANLRPFYGMHAATDYSSHIFRCDFLVIFSRIRLTSLHKLHIIIFSLYFVGVCFIIVNFFLHFKHFLPRITLTLNHYLRSILYRSFIRLNYIFTQSIVWRLLIAKLNVMVCFEKHAVFITSVWS